MPSANAGPISGSELIRAVQGNQEVWLTRTQFVTWLASADKVFPVPRPGMVPLPVSANVTLRASQFDHRIRLYPSDIATYTGASGAAPAVPVNRLPGVIDGSILINGSQNGFDALISPAEMTAAITASGGTPTPASAYTLDFANASYAGPSGSIADPFASLLTHSRSTELLAPNAAGIYQSYAPNTPARNDRGLWVREQARTNSIRNNSMVGAAANTIPTAWVETLAAAGITRTITPGTDANGLPCLDVAFLGTATANGAYTLQLGANAAISADAAKLWILSCWLGVQAGTLPIDGTTAVRLQAAYVNSVNSGQGVAQLIEDRLMARDTTPRRLRGAISAASLTGAQQAAIVYIKPSVLVNFKSGTTYSFTLRIICPMLEEVASLNEDASLPILTTTAAVTHQPDSLVFAGPLLAMAQGAAASLAMTTATLRASGLDYRLDKPLLKANGSVALLKRTAKGEMASELGSAPVTYRGYRSTFGARQKHLVQWASGKVRVASTATGYATEASGAVPAISSLAITADGCIARLDLTDTYLADMTPYTNATVDLGVYGTTSGGIVAAASAIAAGKTAIVIGGFRDANIGGMAAGGLGQVDASVAVLSDAFGGMSLDYARWCNEYGGKASLDTKQIPSRISTCYFDYLVRKYDIPVHFAKGVLSASKTGTRISTVTCRGGQVYTGGQWTDASYEVDLAAIAGVSCRVGREASDANNAFNGNRGSQAYSSSSAGVSDHQFSPATGAAYTAILNIDPYATAGVSGSGLLPGVQSYPAGTIGATDGAIQAYCFRTTFTTDPVNMVALPSTPPTGYNAQRYELLGRWLKALTDAGKTAVAYTATPDATQFNLGLFMIFNTVEGSGTQSVYDMNSNNGFSWDTFGANWGEGWAAIMTAAGIVSPSANYAVGTYAEREIFWKWQEGHQRGMMYFLQWSGDARIPTQIRDDARLFGLDKRYYLDPHENDTANWMYSLYVREARSILGVMTLEANDITATDGTAPRSLNTIAAGSYSIDSHHVRRFVDTSTGTARVINEGNLFINAAGNKTFPVAMEMIMPQASECTNVTVTFGASARHTGFGALRMEMSHMALSEAAGLIAAQVGSGNVQTLDYPTLRTALLARGCVVPQTN
jgi:hypothetical protein